MKLLFRDKERVLVAMLLILDDSGDSRNAFEHFRISRLHEFGDKAGQLVQERLLTANQMGMPHGAPHDFAQHVTAAIVSGKHAIVDQKGGSAGMVGDDAKRGIDLRICPERDAQQAGRMQHDGRNQVRFVIRKLALQNRRNSFQAHAGIDGGAWQGSHHACCILVELHEDQVPEFNEAAAAIKGELFMFTAGFGCFRA